LLHSGKGWSRTNFACRQALSSSPGGEGRWAAGCVNASVLQTDCPRGRLSQKHPLERGDGTFGENRTHVSTVKQTTRESNPARSDLESNLRTLRVAYLSPWSLCALLPVGTLVGPAIEHEVLGHCMTVGA